MLGGQATLLMSQTTRISSGDDDQVLLVFLLCLPSQDCPTDSFTSATCVAGATDCKDAGTGGYFDSSACKVQVRTAVNKMEAVNLDAGSTIDQHSCAVVVRLRTSVFMPRNSYSTT